MKNITSVLIMLFLTSIFAIELGCSQSASNWGESSCDAQLSIGLYNNSNNIVSVNSTVWFVVKLKNSSPGVIRINPRPLDLYLTNSFGKSYQVKQVAAIDFNIPVETEIASGEIGIICSELLKINKDIEPGDYVFSPITRDITTTDNKVCTLKSNSLKVKVVKSK